MNNTLKSLIYTIAGIVIFIAVIKLFLFSIPILLTIALVGYVVFKGKNYLNNRRNKNREEFDNYSHVETYTDNYDNQDDKYTGNIIDVEYEDVN